MGQVISTRKKPRRRTAFRRRGATDWKVVDVVLRGAAPEAGAARVSSLAAGAITATAVVGVLPSPGFSADLFAVVAFSLSSPDLTLPSSRRLFPLSRVSFSPSLLPSCFDVRLWLWRFSVLLPSCFNVCLWLWRFSVLLEAEERFDEDSLFDLSRCRSAASRSDSRLEMPILGACRLRALPPEDDDFADSSRRRFPSRTLRVFGVRSLGCSRNCCRPDCCPLAGFETRRTGVVCRLATSPGRRGRTKEGAALRKLFGDWTVGCIGATSTPRRELSPPKEPPAP